MKTRRNKALLQQKERDRVFAIVRRKYELAIMAVEKELQKYLEPQVEKRVAERQKGIRKSSLKVPQKLLTKHKKLVIGMLIETNMQAVQIARDNIKRFKKQNKRGLYRLSKLKELESPFINDQLKLAYMEKGADYAKHIKTIINQLATDITKARFANTIHLAKSSMVKSAKDGLTREQTRKELQAVFENYNTYQLDRVITTEQTRMIAASEFPEYQADDLIIGYEWKVNYVGCPICDAKQAMGIVSKDEVMKLGLPPAHPNCECTLEPVFRDLK